MTISRSVKVWVIVNFAILSIVPVLFVMGLLYPIYWAEMIDFAGILMLPLFLHIFYQGYYIGGFVAAVTLLILIVQIRSSKKSGMSIPALWITGEVFIILAGVLDVLPIASRVIGDLYYMIPGW